MSNLSNNSSSSRYAGNGASPWTNDPSETSPFTRFATAPDPRAALAVRAASIASLSGGISYEAREQLRVIMNALDTLGRAGTDYAANFIRNTTSEDETVVRGGVETVRRVPKQSATQDQRDFAQKSLDAQRQIIEKATADANAAYPILRQRVLADAIQRPDRVTPEQMADRKADLVAALEAAGKSGANALGQRMIHQAVTDGDDGLTVYVLCDSSANGPLKFRAESLGLNQQTLQIVYVTAYASKFGEHPLQGALVGQQFILALPDLQSLLKESATQAALALDTLAKACGLR